MVRLGRCRGGTDISSTPEGLPYLRPSIEVDDITNKNISMGLVADKTKGENHKLRELLELMDTPRKQRLVERQPSIKILRRQLTDGFISLSLRDAQLANLTTTGITSNQITKRRQTERQKQVNAEKVDEFWFLADAPGGVLPLPRRRRNKGYSTEVVKALKNNPAGQEAFREKVGKMKESWKEKLRARNQQRNHFELVSLLSPRCRIEVIIRNAEKADAHRTHVKDEADRRKRIRLESSPMQIDRQNKIRRSKAFLVMFGLSKSCSLFSHTLKQWRRSVQSAEGTGSSWNIKLIKLKITRETIKNLRFANPSNDEEDVEACLGTRQHMAEQEAYSLLSPHVWMLSIKAKIVKKRRAVATIRSYLKVESMKSQVSHLVKKLVASALAIQRWWRRHLPCVRGHYLLLNKQWDLIESTITSWDEQTVSSFEAGTSKIRLRSAIADATTKRVRSAKRWLDSKQRDKVLALVADRNKYLSHQLSQVKTAKTILSFLPTTSITTTVPEILRNKILTVIVSKMTSIFKAKIFSWEQQSTEAYAEWSHEQAVAAAKSQIDQLKGEDAVESEVFKGPIKPYFHRLLHPNEVRLIIISGYQYHMNIMASQAIDSCRLEVRHRTLPSTAATPTALLKTIFDVQKSTELPAVDMTLFDTSSQNELNQKVEDQK